jgi:hypothetical protein
LRPTNLSREDSSKTAHFLRSDAISRSTEEKLDEISEETIKALSNAEKPQTGEFEIYQSIFPISIGIFWDRFLSDNASFSDLTFYASEGHQDIRMGSWQPDLKNGKQIRVIIGGEAKDVDQNMDNILDKKSRILTRTLTMKIKVKGLPFVASTN